MSLMFYDCYNLMSIDLSSFEIKNADTHWMFFNCNSLKEIKIKDNYYNIIMKEVEGFKNVNIISSK